MAGSQAVDVSCTGHGKGSVLRVWQEQPEQSLSKENGKKQGKTGQDRE